MSTGNDAVIPSSANGWYVPAGTRLAAMATYVPTAAVGALLTISIFWTLAGLPVLTFSVVGIDSLARAADVGTAHPAWPLISLAGLEAALATLGLVTFGSVALIVALPTFACSLVTGLVSWATVKTAMPYPSPPPPTVPSWHQPSSPASSGADSDDG